MEKMYRNERQKNGLPIPDEPRKRNTRGCSSSYQPFCFLLMAVGRRLRKKEKHGAYFAHLHLLTLFCFDRWPEASWYTWNYDKGPNVGIRKGLERFGGEIKKKRQLERTREKMRDLQKALHIACLLPYSVGPLASSNCITLPGAAMVKSV